MLVIGGGGACAAGACAAWLGDDDDVCEQLASNSPVSRTDSKPVARLILLEFKFIFSPDYFFSLQAFRNRRACSFGPAVFASGRFVTRMPRITYDIYRSLAAQGSSIFRGSDIVLWYNGRAGPAQRIIS